MGVYIACPHCGKKFKASMFKGSTSEKANAARRRNAQLAGRKARVSSDELLTIYRAHPDCTGEEFMTAIKKETGCVYSRSRVFSLLKKLKDQPVVRTQIVRMSRVAPYSPVLETDKKKDLISIWTDRFNLSKPTLEALTLIAYRQPLTQAQIESARGDAANGDIATLLERKIIRIAGRRGDQPGRPLLYGTTPLFLKLLGLESLHELPNALMKQRP